MSSAVARIVVIVAAIGGQACQSIDGQSEVTELLVTVPPSSSFRPHTDLMIGDADGPEEYIFGQLWDLAMAPDGRVFALDPSADRVSAYKSDGQFDRAWGGSGGGPGEFVFPIDLIAAADRLGVWDSRALRLSWFDFDGELVAEERMSTWSDVRQIALASDGALVVQMGPVWAAPPKDDNGIGRIVRILRDDSTEILAKWNDSISVHAVVTPRSSSVIAIPFATVRRWALIDGRTLAFVPPEANTLILTSLGADSMNNRQSIKIKIEAKEWPPSQREADSIAKRQAQRPVAIRNQIRLPEFKLPIQDVVAGPGRVWMRISTADDYDEFMWIAVTCDGSLVDSIQLPSAFQLQVATQDALLGIHRDTLGVPRIARYRLVSNDPTSEPCSIAEE